MGGGYDIPPGHVVDGVGERLEARRVKDGGGAVEHMYDNVHLGGGCGQGDERVAPLGMGEGGVGWEGGGEECGTGTEESGRMHVEQHGVRGGEEDVGWGQVRVGGGMEGGGD